MSLAALPRSFRHHQSHGPAAALFRKWRLRRLHRPRPRVAVRQHVAPPPQCRHAFRCHSAPRTRGAVGGSARNLLLPRRFRLNQRPRCSSGTPLAFFGGATAHRRDRCDYPSEGEIVLSFLCRTTIIAVCLVGPSALVIASRGWNTVERAHPDDGWRRTAAGWERNDHWSTRPPHWSTSASRGSAAAQASRYDSHPAALVLTQFAAVLFGFYAFPSQGRFTNACCLDRWRFHLARSFRASLFGA